MIKDLGNNLGVFNALDSATVATDTTTAGIVIDTKGFQSGAMCLRVSAYTDGTYTLSVTECATSGGSYTAIPASRIVGTATALNSANEHDKLGFIANQRYVKASIVSASTSSGAVLSASCLLGDPDQGPVATHDVEG